jgi:hypothetical protein
MNVCGVTRLLVPASSVGLAVATIAGRDVYGLIAALVTAGAVYGFGRIRGTSPACALPGAALPAPPATAPRSEP